MRIRYQFSIGAVLAAALVLSAQTPPQEPRRQRDLKVEKLEEEPPPEKPSVVTVPKSYALIIGVADYRNLPQKAWLQFSTRDAEAIYSILISPEGGNFHAENVHRLIGPKATLANMRRELEEWLPSVAQPGDRVLIYFAGHGFVAGGRGYLAPYDVDPNNVASTGYPMAGLGKVIGSRIKATSKILLTDACHSGAIRPEDTQSLNRSLIDLSTSLFSLTASRDREQSFESPDWGGGHGIFTYYVVKGMEGEADQNGDGIVTADELQDYVYRNVREATNSAQNPTAVQGSFDPQMLLAYVPSRAKPANAPAPKYGAFVIEANMDSVEVFVDGVSAGTVNRNKPLELPGLAPGRHTVKGVKMGYEPDGPREETVYPGVRSTVRIRLLIPARRNRSAVDAFDKGVEFYQKGFAQNYRSAVEWFAKALAIDPNYSQAALFMARAQNALFNQQEAEKYFRRAIDIDPDYLEARASFGGMLLDIGNTDESIRQFNAVIQRDPNNVLALTNLAQAYRMKDMYPEAADSARKAIQLSPQYAEPHLWLAESLRLQNKFPAAKAEYQRYLALSNFDSGKAGQLNYYVVGFLIGMGKRKRATQQDIWKDLRSLAYFGLCDCDNQLSQFDPAIRYCQEALRYDQGDPYIHYALGLAFLQKAVQSGNTEMLPAALRHFRRMLEINPDLEQSQMARQNIANIEGFMRKQ
jgi:tetratricopeptide (TPR) repeat protein